MLLNLNVRDLCWVLEYVWEEGEVDEEDDVVKAARRLISQLKPQVPDAVLAEIEECLENGRPLRLPTMRGVWAPNERRSDPGLASNVSVTTGFVMALDLDVSDLCWVLNYVGEREETDSNDDVVKAAHRVITQIKPQVPDAMRTDLEVILALDTAST